MKKEFVKLSFEIPAEIHRKLKVKAAKKGCSMKEMILWGLVKLFDLENNQKK